MYLHFINKGNSATTDLQAVPCRVEVCVAVGVFDLDQVGNQLLLLLHAEVQVLVDQLVELVSECVDALLDLGQVHLEHLGLGAAVVGHRSLVLVDDPVEFTLAQVDL